MRERIPEPVPEVRGAPVLFLEDGVFDDRRPGRAVFLVAGFESGVLCLCERPSTLASGLFE